MDIFLSFQDQRCIKKVFVLRVVILLDWEISKLFVLRLKKSLLNKILKTLSNFIKNLPSEAFDVKRCKRSSVFVTKKVRKHLKNFRDLLPYFNCCWITPQIIMKQVEFSFAGNNKRTNFRCKILMVCIMYPCQFYVSFEYTYEN